MKLGKYIVGPLFLITFLFGTHINAASYKVKPFTLLETGLFEKSYLSVYAVSAQGYFGTPTIDTVFYKFGPIKLSGTTVEIPEMNFDVSGVRGPTHLAIVIHSQAEYSLNRINSVLLDQVPVKFEEPDYYNTVYRTVPNDNNIRLQHKIVVPIKTLTPLKLQNYINR